MAMAVAAGREGLPGNWQHRCNSIELSTWGKMVLIVLCGFKIQVSSFICIIICDFLEDDLWMLRRSGTIKEDETSGLHSQEL